MYANAIVKSATNCASSGVNVLSIVVSTPEIVIFSVSNLVISFNNFSFLSFISSAVVFLDFSILPGWPFLPGT